MWSFDVFFNKLNSLRSASAQQQIAWRLFVVWEERPGSTMVLLSDDFCLNVVVSGYKMFLKGINIVLWCRHALFDRGWGDGY
jgi:hypothetical protein